MAAADSGLTTFYNALHAPSERSLELQRLRDAQVNIDRSVAAAYGWSDLPLDHDFHEVDYLPANDRVRFTISERARREVLRRLAELNRERYEEERKQGLHDGKTTARKPVASRKPAAAAKAAPPSGPARKPAPDEPQPGLFPASSPTRPPGRRS